VKYRLELISIHFISRFLGWSSLPPAGKQCLILFGADLSEDWKTAQLSYRSRMLGSTRRPQKLRLTCNYADISAELNSRADLVGNCAAGGVAGKLSYRLVE
jgi:hypothetical protein